MSCDKLYIGVDNAVTLTGMRDRDGNYLNTGVSTWILYECDDTEITSVNSGDLDYVTASEGNYLGTIPASTEIEEDVYYWLEISFVDSGLTDSRTLKMIGAYRGKT